MADILIRGMEMPKSCYKCDMRRRDGMDIVCPVAHERFSVNDVNILEYRLDNCPLFPVPPHGDLIDRDVLGTFRELVTTDAPGGKLTREYVSMAAVRNVRTIIPASEERT